MTTAAGQERRRLSAAGWLLVGLLGFYRRFIGPLLGANCRFYPSCSAYALEAVQLHGAAKGSWLAARRLSRCHPFHRGGIDPVPGSVLERDLADQKASDQKTSDQEIRELAGG
jgi:uncharacterized protein